MKTERINLTLFTRDVNGNSLVKFKILTSGNARRSSVTVNGKRISTDKKAYGYSIQTSGNLPETHRIKQSGVKVSELTPQQSEIIKAEIVEYLIGFGSDKQKYLIK